MSMNSAFTFAEAARHHPEDATINMVRMRDGWPVRRWHRPAPGEPRAHLLFMGGRGDFIEKYLESFAAWHAAGYAVTAFDWRGQGGSGRLIADRHVGHIDTFETWVDDLAEIYADWQGAGAAPHIAIGHSMGGHLLLRALGDKRIAPDGAVLVAPMLGFTAPYPLWVGEKVARAMCRWKGAETAAWKISEKPGSPQKARQSILTHDQRRYADELWWHEQNPDLPLGPASWQWVGAAYQSMQHLALPGLLEAVTTPMLILSARFDLLVNSAATRRQAARLPTATLHQYGREAAHEILREADAVRDDALRRIADHVAQCGDSSAWSGT